MAQKQDDFAKKRAQRQKKIRRRRLIIGFWSFIIIAMVVAVTLSLTVLFPIKQVTAKGSKLYTSSQIVKATGINEKCNLFTLSEKIVANNVRSVLPYIDSIEMKRVFPDKIEITAADAKEYACYFYNGSYYAVSERGYVLNRYEEPPENTFVIECSKISCKIGDKVEFSNQDEKRIIETLMKVFSSNDITVNGINVTDQYNLRANVDGRFEVLLGSENDLENKVAHLSGMIKEIDSDRSGRIDVSMWTSDKKEGSFIENSPEKQP